MSILLPPPQLERPPLDIQVLNKPPGGDRTVFDPALNGGKPVKPNAGGPFQDTPNPPGTWFDPNRGRMITGMFGATEPFTYAGQGPHTTTTNSDGSTTVTQGGEVNIKPGDKEFDVAAAVLRQEEGFAPTGKWDVNRIRGGYGSETITTKDGQVVQITKGMAVNRDDAERDLQRRIPELDAQARAEVGSDWDKIPEDIRGVLLSPQYNYGNLYSDLRTAIHKSVQTGDYTILGQAVINRGHLPGIQNPARRDREGKLIIQLATAARGTPV